MRIEELLFSDQPFMIFDEGFHPFGKIIFRNPIKTIEVYHFDTLLTSLNEINAYIKQGYYVAGFISYEAGYFFSNMNWKENDTVLPLLYFAVFQNPEKFSEIETGPSQNYGFYISSIPNRKMYFENLDTIRTKLYQGEIYQINYTDKIFFDFEGDILSFYKALSERQPVPYGSWIRTYNWDILSFSPELFFEKKEKTLITKPMKGTYPRGKSTEEDKKNAQALINSEKEKAENLMITDLMRNDLGKISKKGSVQVQNLFSVEKYKTIFQMTSTIQSELSDSIEWKDIFKELFPGGSITGAPKLRAMQLIRELEKPRGIYTGAIGVIQPNQNAVFSIGIRTLELKKGKGNIGIGSGITWDSDPEKEWFEILEKAKFFTEASNKFSLFETILYKNGIFYFQKEHLQRIKNSAKKFGFPFSEQEWISCLKKVSTNCPSSGSYRVKISLNSFGKFTYEFQILENFQKKGTLVVCNVLIDSSSEFRKHKTNLREIYDREGKRSREAGHLDILFLNEKKEITEGSISNIFVKIGDSYFTPPTSSGLLPGIFRNRLLKRKGFYEKTFSLEDLFRSDSVFLCNSLRGILRVKEVYNFIKE
ncbi:aminodeoxychorismate synthase component I [Leptospira noguchii]|uniref:Aminodeoxychorismate synthase component I n=1 Tax=Leptospira noguchii TaxID=28182 RepID=A0AAE9GEV5_9LEPT|nr:aminodeoxychorismate synthase component I [Leptospira noguchii]UOG30621.1 aminodeoxychorismate synthase component I [Leptospira noguchii]UOG34323.1 aminodeoxychorismate synthase component I [Leptospira noguchii]UOG45188.1 aminodeoxychorismate synthase component I [Leptospira noguchii]UOG56748.1 aminodeoxychorismate synthase component I [Leptospira noguchii]